jgi:hypothetical protein
VATPPAFAATPREKPPSPLVGRDAELAYVEHVLERARVERSAHLFTLLGSAGIGKTRFALEVAARASPDVAVLTGRCLGSGAGMTYWPLREIVRHAAGAETAVAVRALLDDDDEADRVASRIALALGTSDERRGGEETAWAFRRLFEALALHGPLVVTIEDAHLAAEALLDLIEHVADRADDTPIVLLCIARPELLQRRPGWGGGMLNAASIRLGPLTPDASEQLLVTIGGPELHADARRQIADAAEGNPLFLEQTLALMAGSEDEQRSVPSSIDALLAARLDGLTPPEAAVLEAASTIGNEFPVAALDVLVPESIDRSSLSELVDSLTRKELLARAPSELPGAGAERMRFRHALIQGAVYGRLPDERAAVLHERVGSWAAAAPRPARDEIVGFHLERAAVLRRRLAPADARTDELARQAAAHLAAAGRRAADRGDEAACTSLLERAAELLPQAAPERSRLLLEVAEAHSWAGDYRPAAEAYERSAAAADLAADETAGLAAAVCRLETEASIGRGPTALEAYEIAERSVARLDEIGDVALRSRAWSQLAGSASWLGRHAEAERAARHALSLADDAGDDRVRAHAVVRLSIALVEGPTPSDPALAEIAGYTTWARALGYRSVEFWLLGYDWELAMHADDRARATRLLAERRALVEELGLKAFAPRLDWTEGWSELETGDQVVGARKLRAALAAFDAEGEGATAGYVAAMLAEHLAQTGSTEADELSLLAADRADANFVEDQVGWRCARAGVLAARGSVGEARLLAREAVDLADETDSPILRAHARLAWLAPALTAGRPPGEVAASLAETAEICERKGLLLWAGRARALLAAADVTV